VEIDGRVNHAAKLLGGLHQDRVRFEGIVAQRQMLAVPLNQSEWDKNHGKLADGLLQLGRPHILHLHGSRQVVRESLLAPGVSAATASMADKTVTVADWTNLRRVR